MAYAPAALRRGAGSGLPRVLLAYVLYDMVEIAIWLAVILYAFALGGPGLVGLAAVVQLVPAALLAPALAGIGDRISRGTALALAHGAVAIATLATTLALLADASVAVVIACSTCATIAIAVVRPIHFATLPQLAGSPERLVSANALSSVADGIAFLVGPLVAGFGVQFAGAWLVLAVASGATVTAAGLCVRLRLPAPVREADEISAGWRSAFAGLAALRRETAALVLLLVLATKFVIYGSLDVLGISFAEDVLGLGAAAAGLILAAIGVGGLVGGAVSGWVATRPRLSPVVGASGVVQGLALAAMAVMAALAPAIVTLILCGIAGAVLMVTGRTLLQRSADDGVLARVFAVQEATALLGIAVGVVIAPFLVSWLSAAAAFVPIGIGAALFSLVGWSALSRLDARAMLHSDEVGLLRRVPFLSALPPFELERLAGRATWRTCVPGDVVIRQGDVGDCFYVVGAGTLAVVVDGRRQPHALASGDGFGEVALMSAVPRTATITAVSEARLLVLEREDFLAAVTGSVGGAALAREVVDGHLSRE